MSAIRASTLLMISLLLHSVSATEPVLIPYQYRWGIYELDPATDQIRLIYTSPNKITTLRINAAGDTFAFSMRIDGDEDTDAEICTLGVDGGGLTRLTMNDYLDVYPAWSPDGSRIAYLSWPGETLDIYIMNTDGGNQGLLYDSGYHDADPHWAGDRIAFTQNSQIWIMGDDGTDATKLTDPPRAGEWGGAVLPFGDYDPRISHGGGSIVFERMVDDSSPHGNYDLFLVGVDGSGETRLTGTGWTQGLASWSPSGDSLVYSVAAMGTEGRYDIFTIDPDGTGVTDLTSELFPQRFLAHGPVYSTDGSTIYFVGEWWDWTVLSSEITCGVSTSEITVGDSITVEGTITPTVQGVSVTLDYSMLGGSAMTRTTTTGSDGSFEDSIGLTETGVWTVAASWEGDPGHEAAESPQIEFIVIEPEEPQGEGGIPGFPHLSIVAGLAIGAILLEFSRKNR